MALRAVVFDFDGVIVDSEPLHFRSLRDALLGEGVEITREEYWDHLLAYDDRSSIRLAFERRGERPDPQRLERVQRAKVERFAELIPEVPVFPGAREVVGALGCELPLAIASGARREEIEAILEGIGLRDAFREIVGAQRRHRHQARPRPVPRGRAPPRPQRCPASCPRTASRSRTRQPEWRPRSAPA